MRRPGYKYILALLDIISVNTSFYLALLLSGAGPHDFVWGRYFGVSAELLFFGFYSFLIAVILQHQNLYKINVFLSGADQTVRIAVGLAYSILGLALLSFFTKSSLITESRLTLLLFFVIALISLFLCRVIVFRTVFKLLSKISVYRRNVLIIGAGQTARLLAANLHVDNQYGIRIVGFVDDEVAAETAVFMGAKVLGTLKNIHSLVKRYRVAEVLVALDSASHDELLKIIDMFKHRKPHLKIASSLYDIIPARLFTERYGEVPVTTVLSHNGTLSQYYFKRLFDFILSLFGLMFLSPILLIIAIAIKIDSKGPILYHQIRIGKEGKPFKFYKFRSMVVNSDKDNVRRAKATSFIKQGSAVLGSTKIVNAQNVTRVGRFIRRTSLDELPQLLNVLRGDMSLVGPRPCLPYEWEQYQNWHKRRLSVIPGCTGLWQVNGRSEVGFDDMVILDLYYINNRSFLFDLKIMLKTIPVMLLGRGAK